MGFAQTLYSGPSREILSWGTKISIRPQRQNQGQQLGENQQNGLHPATEV